MLLSVLLFKTTKMLVYYISKQKFSVHTLKKKYPGEYVLVTGATGSLGTELVKQLSKAYKVIAVGRNMQALQKLQN